MGLVGRGVRKKIKFLVLGKHNLLCLFIMFRRFQPSMGSSYEDLGSNFII
jgi:hypothetical protein